MILIIGIILVLFVASLIDEKIYKETTYYKTTHNSQFELFFDKGISGEYEIFKRLQYVEKRGGRFLFNCYIPKDNGETTEIDVMLICDDGIFVFESKNYSGWIFGNESSKTWTQTLPAGRGNAHKEHFMNPVAQNKYHIKWLKNIVGDHIPIFSIIVFSDRCTFKNIEVNDSEVRIVHRSMIGDAMNSLILNQTRKLSAEEINQIYNQLYPLTQVTEEQKEQHIYNIQKNHNKFKNTFDNGTFGMSGEKRCPRCGGKMIIRTARKGYNAGQQFYGCENYPRCHYTENFK